MKKNKLFKKLQEFFDLEERRKKTHKDDLKKILKKLKMKQRKNAQKLDREQDTEKKIELQQELNIIYIQRKKGVNLLRDLGKVKHDGVG